MLKKVTFCLVCLLLIVGTNTCAGSVQYKITDLGELIYAFSINSSNQVSGHLANNYPAIWDNGSVVRMQPSSNRGYAYDINNNGLVVGCSDSKAVTWDSAGNATFLPLQTGARSSEATNVNNYGTVAGHFLDWNQYMRACYWKNGTFTDLGVPFGHQSTVRGLNNLGDILVDSWHYGDDDHTYIYNNGRFTPILTDLTNVLGSYSSYINDVGMVIGHVVMSDNPCAAYLWQDGATTLLPTPEGKDRPGAIAVNNAGIVVGSAWQSTVYNSTRACIWRGQQVSYLNDLIPTNSGWILEYANDINDAGQIVGSGNLGGATHGFLLTPVPEPSSLMALVFGLGGLGGALLRKKK